MSSINGVGIAEGVSIFSSFYWQVAFWVAGLCVVFFIIVFVISKIKESIRDKSKDKKDKPDVIL